MKRKRRPPRYIIFPVNQEDLCKLIALSERCGTPPVLLAKRLLTSLLHTLVLDYVPPEQTNDQPKKK